MELTMDPSWNLIIIGGAFLGLALAGMWLIRRGFEREYEREPTQWHPIGEYPEVREEVGAGRRTLSPDWRSLNEQPGRHRRPEPWENTRQLWKDSDGSNDPIPG